MTMIRPLSFSERILRFGQLPFEPNPTDKDPEAVRIPLTWCSANIEQIVLPMQYTPVPSRVLINKQAAAAFQALLLAWFEAGLTKHIHTWNGCWVPRLKRPIGPMSIASRKARTMKGTQRDLSNHAWGTAFDINATELPMGFMPPTGHPIRQLVPLANAHGWVWGGDFITRTDAMHLEYTGAK